MTLPKVSSIVAVAMLAACLLVFVGRTGSVRAVISGQNGKIAFQSFSSGIGPNVEIYTMNPDGTGRAQLTHNAARDEFPAQSPDGTKSFRQ
jgi:Tol biopolymer transport system component